MSLTIPVDPYGDPNKAKKPKKADRPKCGAKTRKGIPCVRRAVPGKARCPNHGGLSTGPMTPEGKAKVARNLPRSWEEPVT